MSVALSKYTTHYAPWQGYTYFNLTTHIDRTPPILHPRTPRAALGTYTSIRCWQIKTDKLLLAKHKYVIYKEYNKCIKSHNCFLKPNTHTHTHTHTHTQTPTKSIGIKWKTKNTTLYEQFQNLCNKNLLERGKLDIPNAQIQSNLP